MRVIKRNVPRLSQHKDVGIQAFDNFWQKRGCGIVSLVMVLKYFRPSIPTKTIDELIMKGLEKECYIQGIGWKHQGIVELANDFGFIGKTFDLANTENEKAFELFMKELEKQPVIVSIHKDFKTTNGGHLAVATGFKETMNKLSLGINDPDCKSKKWVGRTVSAERFKIGWKKRFIVIKPANLFSF